MIVIDENGQKWDVRLRPAYQLVIHSQEELREAVNKKIDQYEANGLKVVASSLRRKPLLTVADLSFGMIAKKSVSRSKGANADTE